MRMIQLVAVLLLMSGAVRAGEVTITTAENPVKRNSFGKLTVKVEPGDMVAFQVYPTPTKREAIGNHLFVSGPPGVKYTVNVTVVNFGEEKDDSKTKGFKKRFDTGTAELKMDGEDGGGGEDPLPAPDTEAATLTSKLKVAFKTDPADEKHMVTKLRDLYALYTNESEVARYETWGKLNEAMAATAKTYGFTSPKILATQTAVSEWLQDRYPGRQPGWENVVITDEQRASVRKTFGTIATALGKLK